MSSRSRLDIDNDDFFAEFDRDFARTQKRFFQAFGIVLVLNVLFWSAVIAIVVLVLMHFGIL